jgi:hypothetical protein
MIVARPRYTARVTDRARAIVVEVKDVTGTADTLAIGSGKKIAPSWLRLQQYRLRSRPHSLNRRDPWIYAAKTFVQ